MNSNKEKRKEELLQLLQNVDRPQQDTLSEQTILMQCRSNDKDASKKAFRQLIQRYQNDVYTYVYQMVGDEAASNITRDVFVQAYRNISHLRPDMPVKAWFLKIAKKKLLKVSRKQKGTRQTGEKTEYLEETLKTTGNPCEEIRNLLSAYIDDELSESETDRVEAHLADCEQCCLEFEKLEETVGLVHMFGLMEAPANLQREILTELDKESPLEQLLVYFKRLTDISQIPAPQIATIVATVALIFLGIFSYNQYRQIHDLKEQNAQLRTTVRGIDSTAPELTINTFVIFTGKIISEEMPLEAGKYVSGLIPEPDKAETRFIAGDITSIGDKIATHIRSIQGEITGDQPLQKKNLIIRHITAEIPKYSNSGIFLFLQHLEQKPAEPGEPSDIPTFPVEIYVIDKM